MAKANQKISDDQKSENATCGLHKKPVIMFCKNIECSTAVCQHCWSKNHVGHQIVPLEQVLDETAQSILSNWGKIEAYQTKFESLVSKSVNANEDVLSIMEDIRKLVLSKTDLPKAQSVQELGLFKQNILRELKKQREAVKQAEQKLLSAVKLIKEATDCLKLAIDSFSEEAATGVISKHTRGRSETTRDLTFEASFERLNNYITPAFCSDNNREIIQ